MLGTRTSVVGLMLATALLWGATAGAQRRKKPDAAPPPTPAAPAVDPSEEGRQKARQLLQEGNRLLDTGQYLDALQAFQRAYEAFPSPKLHFNIAQTYHELGRPLDALQHYELFVRDVKREEGQQQWSLANERIFKLMGSIATVQLQASVADATVTVDGNAIGTTPIPQPLRFLPGPHAIIVTKPGYEKKVIEVTLKAGDALTQRVELLTEDQAVAKSRVVQDAEAKRRASQERFLRTRKILRIGGWSALGVGGASLVMGGVFGLLSRSETATVEGASRDTKWTDVSGSYDNAETYRKLMYIGVAVGGALAVAGGVVLALSYRGGGAEKTTGEDKPAPAPSAVTAAPVVGPQHVGLMLAGAF